MDRWPVELVLDARAEHGEGPCFDPSTGDLLWVDIMEGCVHRLDVRSGQDQVFTVDQPVGSVAIRRQGGLLLALRDGFATTDAEGGGYTWLAPVAHEQPGMRFNDGACDSHGRFWAGTMDMGFAPDAGALYCLTPGAQPERMLTNVTISNGIGWSPDDTTMYYVDTMTYRIDAFDFDPHGGRISNRRSLVNVSPDVGMPDGLAVDEEGCIWLALWEGWSLQRYAPDGELVGVVDVPVARVTSCAFGGAGYDELFITTARSEGQHTEQLHAGGVFRARPGVRGLPVHPFAG